MLVLGPDGAGTALSPAWLAHFFDHQCHKVAFFPTPGCSPQQGPVVSLSSYVPDAEDARSEAASFPAAAAPEEFPLLPSKAPTQPPTPAPTQVPAAAGSAGISSTTGSGGSAASAADASPAAENPLLAAFAAERRAMEQLRDDVQAKLASFKVGTLRACFWARRLLSWLVVVVVTCRCCCYSCCCLGGRLLPATADRSSHFLLVCL